MALQKSIPTEYSADISANYHHVRFYAWHKGQGVEVVLDSYADKNARDDGKKPLGSLPMQLPLADFDAYDINALSIADLYAVLKTKPQWDGAVDV